MSPPATATKSLSNSSTLPTILDRAKLGAARRSTPDSEALVSSDDEHEHVPGISMRSMHAGLGPKPARRSSWLSEVQSNQPRKVSFSSYAGNLSQPATPSGEHGPWPTSSTSFKPPTSNNYPWSTQIWNADARKELPMRFSQMQQSLANGDVHVADDRDAFSAIPFQIPLEPNRKVYRSLSYSVGQLDDDHGPSSTAQGFGKMIPVREDEDDGDIEQSSEDSSPDVAVKPPEPKSEDAADEASRTLLKQASHSNAHSRKHSASPEKLYQKEDTNDIAEPLVSDSAIDENDDVDDLKSSGLLSDLGNPLKRGHWHSSLGFGGVEDPQSRRHSFADVPARAGFRKPSLIGFQSNDSLNGIAEGQEIPAVYGMRRRRASQMSSYESAPHMAVAATPPTSAAAAANMLPPYLGSSYGAPQAYARSTQTLHVVSFKCARADIYYIPAGTGLEVKKGDMVVVDGDRGIDLGTISHSNVTMQQAKALKDEYAEMHFRWLMLFSRTGQNGAIGNEASINPSSASPVTATARATPGHHGETELRPKMIKRHAQSHEIHLLKDKEGSEAKAKRVCAGKVAEHSLNMEILDAEFQYDNKKLTFFYFAEAYINFNDLVSDLFKTYKTRIWMSAVNPASFATGNGPPLPQLQQQHPHIPHQQQLSSGFPDTGGPPAQQSYGMSQVQPLAPVGTNAVGFPHSFNRAGGAEVGGSNNREIMLPPGMAISQHLPNHPMFAGQPHHVPANPTSNPSMNVNKRNNRQAYQNGDLSSLPVGTAPMGARFEPGGMAALKNGVNPNLMMMDSPGQQFPVQQFRSPQHNQYQNFHHQPYHQHRSMAYRNGENGQWDHRPGGPGVGVNAELASRMNNLGLA